MGYIKANFLSKEYSIPEDVLVYIGLLNFTESVKTQLISTFVIKVKDELEKDNTGLLGDEDMVASVEQQVGRFISKLCDSGIYTRTVSDYLNNNKGYQYISDVNKAALGAIKSFLQERLSSLQEGLEEAGQKADSRVTGMGFSIFSGSFINHAIYAAMEASTLSKQEKEADAVWRKETHELTSRLEAEYNKKSANYISNEYIPNMEAAFTLFAYELLDKYVADLIANGKFDSKTLDYIDISRSNDLLKNLTLSNNKKVILENAFSACPYNIAVYMQAMKYDLLDYESFQTAKLFKLDGSIISFLEENLGGSPNSEKRRLNFKNAELLSLYTGRSLREITAYVADFIVDGYAQTVAAFTNNTPCYNIMAKVNEENILAGNRISKEKTDWVVDPLAPTALWDKLTSEYGHDDLLDRLLKLLPDRPEVSSKEEYDAFLKERLFVIFEDIRQERVATILAQRQEDARRKEEEAEKARIAAEKRRKFIKYSTIIGSVIIVLIIAISLITTHFNAISNIEDLISVQKYEHAFDAVNSSNLSAAKKQEYRDKLIPLMQNQAIKDLGKYQIINADDYGVFLEDNEIVVRDENGEGLLYCKGGRSKILDQIMYANGYIFFVEASDNWGYDVKYISIENGGETHIDTFDEFDRFVKLEDGRIFIDSLNSDEMFVLFDPYKLSVEKVNEFSPADKNLRIVYDSNLDELLSDKKKIEYASKILGLGCDESGKISLNADLGNFINGDNPLFGEDGHFELGAYSEESKGLIIDTLDWVSEDAVKDYSKVITALQTLYGTPFYSNDIGDEYAWTNVEIYKDVLCVQNEDGTVTVRWVYDVSEKSNTTNEEYDEYLTWYNVEFASSFLGKELTADGSLPMGPGDYEAMSNDMYLFDIPGRFSHGWSSPNADPVVVDILDWVTTETVDNFNNILNPLIDRYGDDYRVQHYDDAAGDAYMWKNVEIYEYVICWKNADGTVDIRWIFDDSKDSN